MKNRRIHLFSGFSAIASRNNFLLRYLRESYSELKKVKWPSRAQVISHTIIVIISVALAMAVTAGIDFGLSSFIQYLVERGR